MRSTTIILGLATAFVLAAGALAVPAAKDPEKLILTRGDFPAHSDYDSSRGEAFGWPDSLTTLGVKSATAANYSGATYSKQTLLTVTGVVVTTASAADATKAFGVITTQGHKLWDQFGFKKVSGVPAFGPKQTATYNAPGAEGSIGTIHLLVQKGSIVWWLSVSAQRGPPGPPLSELIGDVKTYAAMQKAKIEKA